MKYYQRSLRNSILIQYKVDTWWWYLWYMIILDIVWLLGKRHAKWTFLSYENHNFIVILDPILYLGWVSDSLSACDTLCAFTRFLQNPYHGYRDMISWQSGSHRQTYWHTGMQTNTQIDIQKDTQTDIQTDTQTDIQKDRQTHRQTYRHRHAGRQI